MTVTFLLAACIVLVAAIFQTGIGFGFAIIAAPLLSLIYPPHIAIHINIVLSLVVSVIMLPIVARAVDWGMFRRFVAGSIVGTPVGMLFYIFANESLMKLCIGVFILCVTALIVFQYAVRQSRRNEYLTGIFSGALTTSIGMPGPPLLIYFAASRTGKTTLRATSLTYFLIAFALGLILQQLAEPVNLAVWMDDLLLVPVTLVGMALGQVMFRYLSEQAMRYAALALLAATGIALLASIDF